MFIYIGYWTLNIYYYYYREEDCTNELHCDNKQRTSKTFEDGKKNKATGPDNIKGELYRALGESNICVKTLQEVFQNIIDRYLKIKSWGKSNTRLIPKVNKLVSQQEV